MWGNPNGIQTIKNKINSIINEQHNRTERRDGRE